MLLSFFFFSGRQDISFECTDCYLPSSVCLLLVFPFIIILISSCFFVRLLKEKWVVILSEGDVLKRWIIMLSPPPPPKRLCCALFASLMLVHRFSVLFCSELSNLFSKNISKTRISFFLVEGAHFKKYCISFSAGISLKKTKCEVTFQLSVL